MDTIPNIFIFLLRQSSDIIWDIEWCDNELHAAHNFGLKFNNPNCFVNIFSHWTKVICRQYLMNECDDFAEDIHVHLRVLQFLFHGLEISDHLG